MFATRLRLVSHHLVIGEHLLDCRAGRQPWQLNRCPWPGALSCRWALAGTLPPSERAVAHLASKLVAIARTARRGIQLLTLHFDGSALALDTLRITPRLSRAEQDRGDGGDDCDDCEETSELEGIGNQQSADDRHHLCRCRAYHRLRCARVLRT